MRSESEKNRISESYDYILVYKRILNLCPELRSRDIRMCVKNRIFSTEATIELILSKFIDSLSSNVIPLESTSGIPAYFILPRLQGIISWDEWSRIVPSMCVKYNGNFIALRQILYVTLVFLMNIEAASVDIDSVMRTIRYLISSADPV
jgi:hypothetical protein